MVPEYSALQQVLYNRGIPIERQEEWLNAGWNNIYPWQKLAEDKMKKACDLLYNCIEQNLDVIVIVDSDTDGYTSSAIITNYLYTLFPQWTHEHLRYVLHEGKEHGLSDVMDKISKSTKLVIVPDAGTNDWNEHQQLEQSGIKCLVLDHHECNDIELIDSSPAIIINVQLENYPNKSLTGAGVTWQFCRAFDDLYAGEPHANDFIDLCAIGNCADMADLRQIEIRAIMNIGLSNIRNPFMYSMCRKNDYSIQKMNGINYYSLAFYLVPFINATIRSGTMEEKKFIFDSLLLEYSFDNVESSKRGEKGKLVPRYEEAVTVAERVKRRQTKLQDESMELLEKKIEEEKLLDNAIILCLCEPNEVEASIAGLVGNKIQAKYQHPTLVLRRTRQKDDAEDIYRGSARNYSLCPIENMKSLCESTGDMLLAAGHEGAWGAAIAKSKLQEFIEKTNELYKDVVFIPAYWVDYIWNSRTIDSNKILDIAELNIYGQEIPESLVAVKDICLQPSMVTLMGLEKGHPTLKIQVGDISFIKFKSSQEEYEQFCEENMILTCVCKPNKNEWNGNVNPQLIIEDFELREEWVF